jgi:hypothetical protein
VHTVAVADLPTLEATVLGPGRWSSSLAATVECDAGPKPACAAQVLYRFIGPIEPATGGPK